MQAYVYTANRKKRIKITFCSETKGSFGLRLVNQFSLVLPFFVVLNFIIHQPVAVVTALLNVTVGNSLTDSASLFTDMGAGHEFALTYVIFEFGETERKIFFDYNFAVFKIQ